MECQKYKQLNNNAECSCRDCKDNKEYETYRQNEMERKNSVDETDILMVKRAITLIIAGFSAKYPSEIELLPNILQEIAQDYRREIKKQIN